MISLLALLLAPSARADDPMPALMILHVDPAMGWSDHAWRSEELGARVEFPLPVMAVWTALGLVSGLTGNLDRAAFMLSPKPPISAMYTGYLARSTSEPARWDGGGGLALRFRPLTGRHPAVAGLWLDVGGRYGTRGWGVDGGLGWDLPLGSSFTVGPALGLASDGGYRRALATLTVSWSLHIEDFGRDVEITPETPGMLHVPEVPEP